MREEPCGSHHVEARALKWETSDGLTEEEEEEEDGDVWKDGRLPRYEEEEEEEEDGSILGCAAAAVATLAVGRMRRSSSADEEACLSDTDGIIMGDRFGEIARLSPDWFAAREGEDGRVGG